MAFIRACASDHEQEISLFQALRFAVQQAGVPVDGSRCHALTYFVSANRNFYGDQYTIIVERFIKTIQDLAKQYEEKAACEISWALDRAIRILFLTEIVALVVSNPELANTANAIAELYLTCKSENEGRHAKGELVHYGGLPRDMVPEWSNAIIDSNG